MLKALNNFNTSLNSNHVWLGLTDFWYGKILIEKSQYKAAEKYIRTALSIYKKNYPKDHPNEISANAELGIALFYQKKYTEAEKLLLNGYESIKVIKGEKNHNTIRFLEYLVKLYEKSKNSDKLAYYNQLLLQAKK